MPEFIFPSAPLYADSPFDVVISGHVKGHTYIITVKSPSNLLQWQWEESRGYFSWPPPTSGILDDLQDQLGIESSQDETQMERDVAATFGYYTPPGLYTITAEIKGDSDESLGAIHGEFSLEVPLETKEDAHVLQSSVINELKSIDRSVKAPGATRLIPPGQVATKDLALWGVIKGSTIAFNQLEEFVVGKLCPDPNNRNNKTTYEGSQEGTGSKDKEPYWDPNSYEELKEAIDQFMIREIGCEWDTEQVTDTLTQKLGKYLTFDDAQVNAYLQEYYYEKLNCKAFPYLSSIKDIKSMPDPDDSDCRGILKQRLCCPLLIELIWSYWHEESMVTQTMKAITLRFQNKKWKSGRDPLSSFNTNPLRKLNNLLWGYIQDEQNRLTVRRRAYEYDHHYGISLYGEAIRDFQPSDSRRNFIEAFHRLLYLCTVYFKELDDHTVEADGFPLKSALREVHMILAEGAHNQYGDLPWVAKREMLIEQFILSRPEVREFLGGRVMVPYKEGWMESVDTMKRLQGWSDVSVEQFAELGRRGEQLLLSIRLDDWNSEAKTGTQGGLWAQFWRDEIQDYIHSYRAVTGVDLTDQEQLDGTQPSVHLRSRLSRQKKLSR